MCWPYHGPRILWALHLVSPPHVAAGMHGLTTPINSVQDENNRATGTLFSGQQQASPHATYVGLPSPKTQIWPLTSVTCLLLLPATCDANSRVLSGFNHPGPVHSKLNQLFFLLCYLFYGLTVMGCLPISLLHGLSCYLSQLLTSF